MGADFLVPRLGPGSAAAPVGADGWAGSQAACPGRPGHLEAQGSSQLLALPKGRCHLHAFARGISRMWFLELEVQRDAKEIFQL